MKKGVIVLVVLMAVIFCGNVSAMYQYQLSYPPETYQPDMPTMITEEDWVTEEDWNNLLAGGSGSSNVQEYINRANSYSQENVVQEGSNIQSGDSSQGTSTGSSASPGSSPSADSTGSTPGTAVNNSPNTATTQSGTPTDDNGKSDESSKIGTQSSNDTPWGAYAVGGIISVLAIGAIGFYFKGTKFGR
ncbi:MAG: hypothetical protein B655_1924 [Methanobacterium sp. Maddingley MBC34]|nr:MAG: hypothetical protein B655_1924 [Methanobacterium sp. Maddingley MBC34]